jgi:hypothetical protein
MNLPAGTHLLSAAGRIRETTIGNDRGWSCTLSGDQDAAQDGFLIGEDDQNYAPFSMTNTITLSNAGSVEVDCLTSDTQKEVSADRIVMTALNVDALN